MSFDRVKAAIAYLQGKPYPVQIPTPADANKATVDPIPVAITTTDGVTAVAPATQSAFADPIEIRTYDHQGLMVLTVDGLDAAKANAQWLTKGKDRTAPAHAVLLKDCTSDHLQNIVANKPNLSADYHRIIVSILADRGETLNPPTTSLTTTDTDDQDDDNTPSSTNRFGL